MISISISTVVPILIAREWTRASNVLGLMDVGEVFVTDGRGDLGTSVSEQIRVPLHSNFNLSAKMANAASIPLPWTLSLHDLLLDPHLLDELDIYPKDVGLS